MTDSTTPPGRLRPTFRDRIASEYGTPPDFARVARDMSPAPGWTALVEIGLRVVWSAPAEFDIGFSTKDKYGELVFELRRVTAEIADLMDDLEVLSGSMCEVCGAEASQTDDHGWIRTLCESHRAAVASATWQERRALYDAASTTLATPSTERLASARSRLSAKHRPLLDTVRWD